MGAFTGFVGRRTRKIPLSQGFSSFKTVHRTDLGNSAKPTFPFTLCGAPFDRRFRRLRTATIGASRPPRPPRQSRKLSFADFHAPCNRIFFDKRLSFVRERNKQGSWRSQLLGNSAKPTFHAPLEHALFLSSRFTIVRARRLHRALFGDLDYYFRLLLFIYILAFCLRKG